MAGIDELYAQGTPVKGVSTSGQTEDITKLYEQGSPVAQSLIPAQRHEAPAASAFLWNANIARGDDRIAAVDTDSDLNDGEKDWLKKNVNYLTPEQFRESREVMAGRTEKQSGWKEGGNARYYFGDDGLPVAVAELERPPDNRKLESVWGSQEEAQDDNPVTTFAKSLWNGFIGIVKTPAAVLELLEAGGGGGAKNLLNRIERSKGLPETGMITEPLVAGSANVFDKFSFATKEGSDLSSIVDVKAFDSMADFFNSENWHPTSDNIIGGTGQEIGTVLQFLVGGRALGIKGPMKFGTAPASKVIASYAPSVGLSSSLVLSDAIDAADQQGLKGDEKYAVAMVNAIGQGILEMAIGGSMERGLLGSTVKAGVQREISNAAVKAFRDAGGEITPQALRAAFGATVKESARIYPKVAGKYISGALGESGEELTQQLWSNSLMALNQKVHGRDAESIASPEALKEYFTSALGGFLGGLGGGGVNLVNGTLKEEARGSSIYRAVAEGKQLELRNGLDQMVRQGKMTPEQRELADFRIQSYERYDSELKDVVLDDKQKESVFNLTWNDQNVQDQIKKLQADETMTPAIKEAKIKVLNERSKSYVDEIAGIIRSAQPEDVKTEEKKQEDTPQGAQAQPKADEWKNETGKPIDTIRSVAEKTVFAQGPETDEEFNVNMNYPREVLAEETRIRSTQQVQDDLREGRIKQEGELKPEQVAQKRIEAVTADYEAQMKKLDEELLGKQQSPSPVPAQGKPVEDFKPVTPKDVKIREKQERLAAKAVAARPGFELQPMQKRTESLAGKELMAGKAKAGDSSFWNRRMSVDAGNVLDVQRIKASDLGKKELKFPGQTRGGYMESLTAHKEGEGVEFDKEHFDKTRELIIKNNVGGIKKDDGNYKLINRLLDEGYEVKLVVTDHPKHRESEREGKGYIEYRVIARKPGAEQQVQPKVEEKKPAAPSKPESAIAEKRRIDNIIKNSDDVSFTDALLKYFINGGKVRTEDWERITGFRKQAGKIQSEEYKDARWFLSDSAKPFDQIIESVNQIAETEAVWSTDEAELTKDFESVITQLTDRDGKQKAIAWVLSTHAEPEQALPEDWQEQLELEGNDLIDDFAANTTRVTVGGFPYDIDINQPRFGLSEEMASDQVVEQIQKEVEQQFLQNAQTKGFIETQSAGLVDDFTETFGSGIGTKENAGAGFEEGLETFTATPQEVMPADISRRPSMPEIFSEQDALDQIAVAKSVNELHSILDRVTRDQMGSPAIYNAIIKRQGENLPEDDEIDYQENPQGPLASSDPELFLRIQERLSKLFPSVQVFKEPDSFQSFLDKNFPGQKLDLTKIGAAIGEAVYIDPQRARQSTALHEYAHYYWGMLPSDNKLKQQLEEMFGSEEAAVEAIGNVGTDAAKIKLSGSALTKFLEAVREFWRTVKNAIWPSSITKEEAAKIMADRIWKNADNVTAKEAGQPGPIKYMSDSASDKQRDAALSLQSIANRFDYNDETHTYTEKVTGKVYPSVTTIMQEDPEYSYGNTGKRAPTGRKLHSVTEAIAKGLDPRAAAQEVGLDISEEALESLINQVDDLMAELHKDGQVLSESIVAHGDFGIAGRIDVTVIGKDGTVSIYDFKSSPESPTKGGKYDTPYRAGKATKRKNHATQLALYGSLIASDNVNFGVPAMEIGKMGVIPITYKESGGQIVSVEVEKTIPVDFQKSWMDANKVINEHRRRMEDADRQELFTAEEPTDEDIDAADEVTSKMLTEKRGEIAELQKSPIKAAEKKKRLEQAQSELQAMEDRHNSWRRDLKKIKDVAAPDFDVKMLPKMSKQELIDLHNLILKYDNLQKNNYLQRILWHIHNRMAEMQMGVTGIDWASFRDISKLDVRYMAPSDVPENHPAVQAAVKAYLAQIKGRDKATVYMEETADALLADILREKQVSFKDKAMARVAASKNTEKIFGNLLLPAKKGEQRSLKNPYDDKDSASLSKAELAFLKHVVDQMGKYRNRQAQSDKGYWQGFFPEINKTYWENYYTNGALFARAAHINKDMPKAVLDVEIQFKNPVTGKTSEVTYGEAIRVLNDYASKGKIRATVATVLLQSAKRAAIKEAKKRGVNFLESETQKFGLSATGEMISRFQHESQTPISDQSLDVAEAFKQYMADMIHIDHMQPIMPELTAVQSFYAQMKENAPNMNQFLEYWIKGDVMGKHFIGLGGRGVDNFAKFMQAWTYMNVMTFNIKGGLGLNWVVGKLNQYRAYGAKQLAVGEKRYWANPKKSIAILKHYGMVNTAIESDAQMNLKNLAVAVANFPVTAAEHSIQGAAFFSQMTPEEWSNMDDNGNLIDKSKRISNTRLAQMQKKTQDIQGKYAFQDKRMYKHFAVHVAGMGFKGWMPDFLKERLGQEYIDAYGEVHKGSYRSLKYMLRDLWSIMSDTKNWSNSTDLDVVNNKKNIREMLGFAILLSLSAMASDDKEERKHGNIFWQAFTQTAGLFNLSSWEFLASQPMPALGTLKNLVDAIDGMFSFYVRPGKYGDTGDWMFPGKVYQILPYHKVTDIPEQIEELADVE